MEAGELSFRIAAIRETFEESGILLARPKGSKALVDAGHASEIEAAHRTALCESKTSFLNVLAETGMVLALDELVPYAHWVTPEGMPKRFDTWFFLAAAPPDQLGAHDGKESTDSIWVSPREALEGGQSGRFKLPFPTTRNLIKLGKQASVRTALDDSRGKDVVTVTPVMTRTATGRQLRIPLEAGYDGDVFEVGAAGKHTSAHAELSAPPGGVVSGLIRDRTDPHEYRAPAQHRLRAHAAARAGDAMG
jgi:8-oxo-dGTP pyrophosphatase MutT (NUDIX family)